MVLYLIIVNNQLLIQSIYININSDGSNVNPRCVLAPIGRSTIVNPQGASIITYSKETVNDYNITCDDPRCLNPPENMKCENFFNDVCYLTSINHYAYVGVEDLDYELKHKIYTSDISASNDGSEGINMVTQFKYHNGTQAHIFPAGVPIILKLEQWLELADINLEQLNNNVNIHNDNDRHNTYRFTGANLKVTLDYDNSDKVSLNLGNMSDLVSVKDFVCEVTVDVEKFAVEIENSIIDQSVPYVGSHDIYKSQYVEYDVRGITFNFISTGMIYKFSFSYLVSAITNGIVLIKFAYTITTYVAFYLLGGDSTLYSRYAYQDTSLPKELAQFTLQAALNAQTFNRLDRDNTHVLSKTEIRLLLERAFGKRGQGVGMREDDEESFTQKQIENLATNIIYQGSDNPDGDCLTYSQFIDLVTENDQFDLETVKKRSELNKCRCCCRKKQTTEEDDDDDWSAGILI